MLGYTAGSVVGGAAHLAPVPDCPAMECATLCGATGEAWVGTHGRYWQYRGLTTGAGSRPTTVNVAWLSSRRIRGIWTNQCGENRKTRTSTEQKRDENCENCEKKIKKKIKK